MSTTTRKANAAERQIKLALYVKAHGPVSRAQIQAALAEYAPTPKKDAAARKRAEASARRRFERDKSALSNAGIVLDADEGGLYRVLPADNGDMGLLEKGSTRAAFMRVACTALLQDPDFQNGARLRQAMAKLSSTLEVPDTLPWVEQDAIDSLRPASTAEQGTRRKVSCALEAGKVLRFEYTDVNGKLSKRQVEPIGFYTANGHEYLAAWDRSKQGCRRFRLDRMGRVKVNESGRGKRDFEAHKFDPAQWQVLDFQIGEHATQAVVRISPCALWQARNLCSAYGKVSKDAIGTSEWHVTCANVRKLASWCIANGPGLVPTQPQQAADAYLQLIDEASQWASSTASKSTTCQAGNACDQKSQEEPFVYDASQEPCAQESPLALELASWADGLMVKYSTASTEKDTCQKLADDALLFAVLALIEQAGAVSIPQAAQFLDVTEGAVYKALESLAFCYDAACGMRLNLGEPGCAYASLEQSVGLQPSLTAEELGILASAAATFTSGAVIRSIAFACLQDSGATVQIDYWKEGAPAPQLRTIRPQSITVRDGHTYLQAWCCDAQAQRLFRLDRIVFIYNTYKAEQANAAGDDGQQGAARAACTEQAAGAGQVTSTEQKQEGYAVKAHVAFADGVPVPAWPRISKSKKPTASGVATYSIPWFGSLWLPKQLAAYGASVTHIDPHELAQATGDYARSLKE